MGSQSQRLQRDLLTVLDRMSLSIDEARTDLGSAVAALIDAHTSLAANVLVLQDRVATLESVVVSQCKVLETQAELMAVLLRDKSYGR